MQTQGVLPDEIAEVIHNLRKTGNKAFHDGNYGTTEEAIEMIDFAFYISSWFMEVYGPLSFEAPEFIQPIDLDKEKDSKIKELEEKVRIQAEQYEIQSKLTQHFANQKPMPSYI